MVSEKYRGDIDGLRAVAVVAVIGYHAAADWVRGGFVGVDIFFVISGFLISGIILDGLSKGEFTFRRFYAKRIRRIFPSLTVVLLSCLVAGKIVLLADEYKLLGRQVAAGAGFASNILFWTQSGAYFDQASNLKPLLHLWSLGVEEQFYLLWPPIIFIAWKLKTRIWPLILALCGVSFIINVLQVHSDAAGAFYLPFSRLWELLLGGALAYATAHLEEWRRAPMIRRVLQSNFSSMMGLLLIAAAIGLMNDKMTFPGWWALLPTIGTLLIIAAGPGAWLNRHILATRPLIGIGLISYPLYLWHWPLLSFARIVRSTGPGGEAIAGLVLLSFALAWLTYRLVERPIRSARALRTPVLLGAAVLTLGCAGAYVDRTNGGVAPGTIAAVSKEAPRTPAEVPSPPPEIAKTVANPGRGEQQPPAPEPLRAEAQRPSTEVKPLEARANPVDATVKGAGEPAKKTPPAAAVLVKPPEPTTDPTPEEIYARQQRQFLWTESGENADAVCMEKFRMDGRHDDKCKISDGSRPPTVALIGDSHANAMYLGLEKYFSARGENLVNLGRGGCPPFWAVMGKPDEECEKMDELLDDALNSDSVRTVLLADFTDIYLEGRPYPLISRMDQNNKASSVIYVREFKNAIAKFLSKGKSIVLVMDTPNLGIDPHSCIARPLSGGPVMKKCAVPQAQVDQYMAPSRTLKREVLGAFPNISYLDLTSAFCDGSDCWAMIDNILLYRDGNHLSHDGSLYFSSKVNIRPAGQ